MVLSLTTMPEKSLSNVTSHGGLDSSNHTNQEIPSEKFQKACSRIIAILEEMIQEEEVQSHVYADILSICTTSVKEQKEIAIPEDQKLVISPNDVAFTPVTHVNCDNDKVVHESYRNHGSIITRYLSNYSFPDVPLFIVTQEDVFKVIVLNFSAHVEHSHNFIVVECFSFRKYRWCLLHCFLTYADPGLVFSTWFMLIVLVFDPGVDKWKIQDLDTRGQQGGCGTPGSVPYELHMIPKLQQTEIGITDPYVDDYYYQTSIAKKSAGTRLTHCFSPTYLKADLVIEVTTVSCSAVLHPLEKPLEMAPRIAPRSVIEDGFLVLLNVVDINRFPQFNRLQDGDYSTTEEIPPEIGMTSSAMWLDLNKNFLIYPIYSADLGPIDDSILYDQDKHVSSAIWEGHERGALRCHEHTSKLVRWLLTEAQVQLVERAGFGYLRLIPAISLDNPLISALVERWRRETNTFHLTVDEMTVTLEDMVYLLGLPIDGEPVIGVTHTTCETICKRFLGKAPDSCYTSGGMVQLSWLKEFFSKCPDAASMEDIVRHTRAYLLYLVGSTIFSTTTGNKVPVMYLSLFENFDQAGKYAWGAAALAFLYRALGNASLRSQSTISGCLTLLQCWAYYHLNIGRPKISLESHDCFPLVLNWRGKQSGSTSNRDLTFYRKALDGLQPTEVEWLPYTNLCTLLPEDLRNEICIARSETMLICFDKAERHLPDRFMRQFGMPQAIPKDVRRWERKSRGVDGGVDLSMKMESELNDWSERRFHVIHGEEGVYESEYMHWYLSMTRKFIGRPVPLPSEFQRMNMSLRGIAQIVDTLSTQGMDEHQLQAVTRIRYLAHDSLRDQTEFSVLSNEVSNDYLRTIRGKEKVRRRGVGKRRRKDDSEMFISGEGEQFRALAGEVDEADLCFAPGEVEGDDGGICVITNEIDGNEAQFCHLRSSNHDLKLKSSQMEEIVQSSAFGSGEELGQQNDLGIIV